MDAGISLIAILCGVGWFFLMREADENEKNGKEAKRTAERNELVAAAKAEAEVEKAKAAFAKEAARLQRIEDEKASREAWMQSVRELHAEGIHVMPPLPANLGRKKG